MPKSENWTPRILVVEDEHDLRDALVTYLNMEDMVAHGVGSLAQAQAWIEANEFDVLILDLSLPDGDGLGWLRKTPDLLEKGLIITTSRSDSISRITGVRAGADVYLVKPVLPEELVSLVHNLVRRLHGQPTSGWVLNATLWLLQMPDGRTLKLTHSEHLLLMRLARSAGVVVPKEELAVSLGYDPAHYDYRRMEVMVRRLRNKAKEAWSDPLPLETAHRQGYAFTASIRIEHA